MKIIGAAVIVFAAVFAFAQEPESLPNYRSWQHVKSMVIPDKQHGLYGFHHVYIEPKGLKALQAGKGYPEGTRFALPFYEVKQEGGAIQQGELRMVAWMKKDKARKDTGGWLFSATDANGKVKQLDVKAGCFTCHEAKRDREFVFTEWAPK